MRIAITRPKTITARKIHAASKTLSRSAALRFIDFSTRRKTTAHNGQANNAKEKTCWLYRSQGTKRGATQSHFDVWATRSSHPARFGGSDVWDLCASDRASVHHSR